MWCAKIGASIFYIFFNILVRLEAKGDAVGGLQILTLHTHAILNPVRTHISGLPCTHTHISFATRTPPRDAHMLFLLFHMFTHIHAGLPLWPQGFT